MRDKIQVWFAGLKCGMTVKLPSTKKELYALLFSSVGMAAVIHATITAPSRVEIVQSLSSSLILVISNVDSRFDLNSMYFVCMYIHTIRTYTVLLRSNSAAACALVMLATSSLKAYENI